jgi:hypothetical protein
MITKRMRGISIRPTSWRRYLRCGRIHAEQPIDLRKAKITRAYQEANK